MKLAEALMLRAQHKQDVESLKRRIADNIKVFEGDEPLENPAELIEKAVSINEALLALVKRINVTNSNSTLGDGTLIADALAKRDSLLRERSIYKEVIEAASGGRRSLFSQDEVRRVLTVDIGTFRKKLDDASSKYRKLDAEIQAANWVVDLM